MMAIYYEIWEHPAMLQARKLSTYTRYDDAISALSSAKQARRADSRFELRTLTPDGRLMTPRSQLCA